MPLLRLVESSPRPSPRPFLLGQATGSLATGRAVRRLRRRRPSRQPDDRPDQNEARVATTANGVSRTCVHSRGGASPPMCRSRAALARLSCPPPPAPCVTRWPSGQRLLAASGQIPMAAHTGPRCEGQWPVGCREVAAGRLGSMSTVVDLGRHRGTCLGRRRSSWQVLPSLSCASQWTWALPGADNKRRR